MTTQQTPLIDGSAVSRRERWAWCGYDFANSAFTTIIVTVATLEAASSGRTYIIAWGAILYGVVQLIQGIYQYFTASS